MNLQYFFEEIEKLACTGAHETVFTALDKLAGEETNRDDRGTVEDDADLPENQDSPPEVKKSSVSLKEIIEMQKKKKRKALKSKGTPEAPVGEEEPESKTPPDSDREVGNM